MAFIQSLSRPILANRLAVELWQVLRGHAVFAAGLAIFLAAGQVIPRLYGLEDYIRLSLYRDALLAMLILYLIAFVLGHLIFVMVIKRPKRLIAHLARDYRERFLTVECLAGAALMILLVTVMFSIFTSFKVMIPQIQPFVWDRTFMEWDLALHGGVAPWALLQPVIGVPAITEVISFNYQFWFLVLNATMFWQAFSTADPRLRMQFFLSVLLVWSLVGNLAATLLSSAGPCYYPLVTGEPDPYAPLFDYLRLVGQDHYLPQLNVQSMLWEDYQSGEVLLARGISAMPSMHVASTFLFVLLGWRVHRLLGWLMTGFLILILIGSVHLGWHYAVDGYLSIALTWPIWRLAGWLVDLDPLFRVAEGKARPAPA